MRHSWLPTLLSIADRASEAKGSPFVDRRAWQWGGVDQSLAFRGEAQPPRTHAVTQLDPFLNTSAVRDSCLKLILGRPGPNRVYPQRTASLFPDTPI